MKKISFLIISMFIGTSVFAASKLVSGDTGGKVTPLQIGRSGSVKTLTLGKKSDGSFGVAGVSDTEIARMGGFETPVNTKSNNTEKSNDVIGNDAPQIVLGVQGDDLVWKYETESNWKKLLNFTELYKKYKTNNVVTPEILCKDNVFKYRYDNTDWMEIKGSSCVATDGDTGNPGNNPSFKCNKDGKFEYTVENPEDSNAKWVLVENSSCIATDGQPLDSIIKIKCADDKNDDTDNRFLYFTYDEYDPYCKSDCPQVNWTKVEGSKCGVGKGGDRTVSAKFECKGGLLFVQDNNTWIKCNTKTGSDYTVNTDNSCVDGKLVMNERTTDALCEDFKNTKCGDDGFWYDNDVKQNVSCGAEKMFVCNWKTGTVFVSGYETYIKCNNFVFDCNDLDLLQINGQLLNMEGEGVAVTCQYLLAMMARENKTSIGCNDDGYYTVYKCNSGKESCKKKTQCESECVTLETGIKCRDWYTYCEKTPGANTYDCLSSKTKKVYNGKTGLSYSQCREQCEPSDNDPVNSPAWLKQIVPVTTYFSDEYLNDWDKGYDTKTQEELEQLLKQIQENNNQNKYMKISY